MNLRLHLGELEGTFDMEKAVCNHGFFMMAPNVWNPSTKSLHRPLTLSDSSSVDVTISHPPTLSFLVVQVHGINNVSRVDEELILKQVGRMLRISEKDERDMIEFHQVHEAAKKSGFGRIFRSPSLFEDMVKSILLCNSTWSKTLGMASDLCALQLKLADGTIRPSTTSRVSKKRKPNPKFKRATRGNFPSAKEIASLEKEVINEHCKLGYRANQIVNLAKKVENGSLNLEKMEMGEMEVEQVIEKMNKLKGFGPFATATVLMCLGYYHLVPSDTETLRLLREVHEMKECSKETLEKAAKSIYDRFSPFQSLAYWFDLIQDYETKLGKLSKLSRTDYNSVSGSCHTKKQLEANE
ncbi:HhH-GPD domain [Arabidopsis thaliana x Arabidopsis arenosa]|uniref:HhH-GPD domain n=1 Tax=Arabidopsis thaliana x Arabidopsis arenosa TaxID=1240361 RepID=A0A8T2CC83_9BRAS|nr:HhH-GPD domain [Arabidopsis thaliana x Arabidopsis arenosa]